MPVNDPSYTRRNQAFALDFCEWVDGVAAPDPAAKVPRTAQFRIVNALLDLAVSEVRDGEIPGLEDWEFLALLNFFQTTKFREINPDHFWAAIWGFNEELARKIRSLPRKARLQIILKILAERKTSLVD